MESVNPDDVDAKLTPSLERQVSKVSMSLNMKQIIIFICDIKMFMCVYKSTFC